MKFLCRYCDYTGTMPPPLSEKPGLKELSAYMALCSHMFSHKDKNFNLDTDLWECFEPLED